MKKDITKRIIAFTLLATLLGGLIPAALAAQNKDEDEQKIVNGLLFVEASGMADELPDALDEGQVWTGKSVRHDGGGIFTVTIYAWGKPFTKGIHPDGAEVLYRDGKGPIAEGTLLTITDNISESFAHIDENYQKTYKEAVIWTVSNAEIAGNTPAEFTYLLMLHESADEPGTYYTGKPAAADFTAHRHNPYYWVREIVTTETHTLHGLNWRSGNLMHNRDEGEILLPLLNSERVYTNGIVEATFNGITFRHNNNYISRLSEFHRLANGSTRHNGLDLIYHDQYSPVDGGHKDGDYKRYYILLAIWNGTRYTVYDPLVVEVTQGGGNNVDIVFTRVIVGTETIPRNGADSEGNVSKYTDIQGRITLAEPPKVDDGKENGDEDEEPKEPPEIIEPSEPDEPGKPDIENDYNYEENGNYENDKENGDKDEEPKEPPEIIEPDEPDEPEKPDIENPNINEPDEPENPRDPELNEPEEVPPVTHPPPSGGGWPTPPPDDLNPPGTIVVPTVPNIPAPAAPAVREPPAEPIREPIIVEDYREILLSVAEDYYALDLGGNLYEIFDDAGIPLGVIYLEETENIYEDFSLDNIIPLADLTQPEPHPETTAEVEEERLPQEQHRSADTAPRTNDPIVITAVLIAAAALSLLIVLAIRRKSKKTS